jgi:hypothetical protein
MASSTKNVKLGVCKAYFDGLDLGLTQGGVEVTVSTETHKVEVDQFGKTAINELIMGRTVQVKVPLAETTLRNLVATMPGSALITDGAQASVTLTSAAAPTISSTFTLGGQAFTFIAAGSKPTTAYQVVLGTTQAISMQNAVDAINRATLQAALGGLQASLTSATVITVKVGDPGVLGNAVTATAATGFVAGGATFTGGVAETKARVETSTGTGIDLLSLARVLRLHPQGKADTDFSDDFVVYQAGTPGALTFAYKLDSERVYNIEFTGYPDSAGRLFSTGDLLA